MNHDGIKNCQAVVPNLALPCLIKGRFIIQSMGCCFLTGCTLSYRKYPIFRILSKLLSEYELSYSIKVSQAFMALDVSDHMP